MRCIETQIRSLVENEVKDKLQHEMYWNNIWKERREEEKWINYNMRCIETAAPASAATVTREINYNMRCIETHSFLIYL